MYKIAVLGAGYMGSAITYPLTENGHKVNLWGTWLDDEILDSARKGFHPKLKKALPDGVDLYSSDDMAEAVKRLGEKGYDEGEKADDPPTDWIDEIKTPDRP